MNHREKYKELSKYLKKEFPYSTKDERRISIFYYCYSYYENQRDVLYVLKDICNYCPSPLYSFRIEREEKNIKKMYKSLVKRFENENIFINGDIITVSEIDEYFPKEEGYSIHFEEFDIDEYNKFVNPEVHREYKFDSFFLIFKDCELAFVFGMINVVPWNEKEIQYIAD